jgi:hypothetical protein
LLLALLVTPVTYSLLDDFNQFVMRVWRWVTGAGAEVPSGKETVPEEGAVRGEDTTGLTPTARLEDAQTG